MTKEQSYTRFWEGSKRCLLYTSATYIVAPPAKERIKRMRVCFQYADDTY